MAEPELWRKVQALEAQVSNLRWELEQAKEWILTCRGLITKLQEDITLPIFKVG